MRSIQLSWTTVSTQLSWATLSPVLDTCVRVRLWLWLCLCGSLCRCVRRRVSECICVCPRVCLPLYLCVCAAQVRAIFRELGARISSRPIPSNLGTGNWITRAIMPLETDSTDLARRATACAIHSAIELQYCQSHAASKNKPAHFRSEFSMI